MEHGILTPRENNNVRELDRDWLLHINCGICGGSPTFNWLNSTCAQCPGEFQSETTKTARTILGSTIINYDYKQWTISFVTVPRPRKKNIQLGRYTNFDTVNTDLFINLDVIAGIPLESFIDSDLLKEDQYDRYAATAIYCNIQHARIVQKLREIALLFVEELSMVRPLVLLLEIGELTRSMINEVLPIVELREAIADFAEATTKIINDVERAYNQIYQGGDKKLRGSLEVKLE